MIGSDDEAGENVMNQQQTFENYKETLRQLIIRKAYFREKITLSSGKTSDYYIDARRVTLYSEGAFLCARLILDLLKETPFDAIGGPTLGADPMIGAINCLSHQAGKPLNTFIIRKTPKAHGKQQQVEGPLLDKGSRVVLIDDVATTGAAFVHSMDVLRSMDIKVVKAVCIVDRQEGAKEAVAKSGSQMLALFNVSEIHL